ncbi:selenium metabolism-associated LysR family transcriptional regulator [uncultured Desulfobulbus sp.]|uniref:selenium metabolism-associated LysR family transcriptional regulator n=1 Tax=uncultured Desulfobulbus sp. TaxID=239745 RepID=UPI0029C6211A|nr:selenium metabolism-associated LysR family transcriptional regulator [uncultured Desulfobulbus sp.]
MDIRKLEVFRKVVELKSFTKAAEAALLSQPTVSEHVRSLEEELGLKLVDRLGREAAPTPVGRLLYDYAVRMTQLQQEALQAIARYNGALSGEVRIGASTIPGAYILPRLLASFCRQYPDVRPQVQVSDSRTIASRILDGTVDLGLVGAIWNERGLEWSALFTDTLVVAVPPHHPLAAHAALPVGELLKHPLILREQGSGTRKVIARILEQRGHRETDLRETATLGSNEAVREAVKAGIGIAVLSARSVAQDVQTGTLVALSLEDAAAERPLYLIQRKNREPSPVAAVFLDHLRAAANRETIPAP